MPWKPKEIPTVFPLAGLKVKESGRTKPLEMVCETNSSQENYIVKLWNNVDLKSHGLAREIYGSLLADYFEIKTPDIALVDISPEFANSQPDPRIRDFISASPSLNFGSRYMNGAIQFIPPAPPTLVAPATRIFCFDMLIGNADRRIQKSNMFTTSDGLIIFDHEQAFPHSMPHLFLGGPPTPWDFIQEPWSKEHVLYSSIKGKDLLLEIEGFMSDLERLNDNILITIEESIPVEWNNRINNISNHLANARDNANLFKRSLQELLA